MTIFHSYVSSLEGMLIIAIQAKFTQSICGFQAMKW